MTRRIKADFSEVPPPVETGTYEVRTTSISDAIEGPNATYVRVEGIIVDPGGEHNNASLFVNCPVTGKGAGIWTGYLNGMNVPEEQHGDVDVEELLGQSSIWRVRQEESKDYGIQANVRGFATLA